MQEGNNNGMSDSVKRRLLKILALAERGVDGEKEAAESMLATLMKKHSITIDDLKGTEESRDWVELTFSGDMEWRLLMQVVCKVTGDSSVRYRQAPKARTKRWFNLTKSEHIEVELMFDILKVAMVKEMDTLFSAFVHKNKLYAPSEPGRKEDAEPLTPEQLAQARRIAAMAQFMSPVPIHKAITAS